MSWPYYPRSSLPVTEAAGTPAMEPLREDGHRSSARGGVFEDAAPYNPENSNSFTTPNSTTTSARGQALQASPTTIRGAPTQPQWSPALPPQPPTQPQRGGAGGQLRLSGHVPSTFEIGVSEGSLHPGGVRGESTSSPATSPSSMTSGAPKFTQASSRLKGHPARSPLQGTSRDPRTLTAKAVRS